MFYFFKLVSATEMNNVFRTEIDWDVHAELEGEKKKTELLTEELTELKQRFDTLFRTHEQCTRSGMQQNGETAQSLTFNLSLAEKSNEILIQQVKRMDVRVE